MEHTLGALLIDYALQAMILQVKLIIPVGIKIHLQGNKFVSVKIEATGDLSKCI